MILGCTSEGEFFFWLLEEIMLGLVFVVRWIERE